MMNEIVAHIDPQTGLQNLELVFSGQRTDELDSNLFNSLIILCRNLHTLSIGGTVTLPEDERYVVLKLVQNLAEILKDSLKEL